MALPAPLLEALSSFAEEVSASTAPRLQDLPIPARWLAGAKKLREGLPELKKRAQNIDAALEKLREDTLALGPRVSNFDELVEFLESKELEVEEVLKEDILKAKANRRNLFSFKGLTRDERAQIIGVPERFEKILASMLEALRDTRWWLMAKRAEFAEKDDAPVFDDPELLFQYLDEQPR